MPFDPTGDLTARLEDKEEQEDISLPCTRIMRKLRFLAGTVDVSIRYKGITSNGEDRMFTGYLHSAWLER